MSKATSEGMIINFDEWKAAIEQFRRGKADQIPPGWITSDEWAEAQKPPLSRARGRNVFLDLRKAGLVEEKKFKIWVGAELDILRPVWHYRLIPNPSQAHEKASPKKARSKKTQR